MEIHNERGKFKMKSDEYTITLYDLEDSRLKVEFLDLNADPRFYDTTSMIVDKETVDVHGHTLYQCHVGWYKEESTYMPGIPRENTEILAELDMNMLRSNPEYIRAVMKMLLKRERIEEYLADGLNETPQIPCGNYVGGIMKGENGYRKFFNQDIGKQIHNSPVMKAKRQEIAVRRLERKRVEAERAQQPVTPTPQIDREADFYRKLARGQEAQSSGEAPEFDRAADLMREVKREDSSPNPEFEERG